MDILYIVFKNELAGIYFAQNLIEGFCQSLKLVRCKEADRFEHPDMCLRTDDVIFRQTHIKDTVIAYCKILHQVCSLCPFTPKCTHISHCHLERSRDIFIIGL